MNTVPALATASWTSAASAASLADGFSVRTCLPAWTAARFHGPCRLLANGLWTTSISGSVTSEA